MRTTFYRDFLTGLTGLVGLAGLIVMLMIFGELTNFGQKTYTLTAIVADAGGLRSGSPVTLSGVRIGELTQVRVRTGSQRGAALEFKIRNDIQVPRGVVAGISQSFVGESTFELTLPADADSADVFAAGEAFDAGDPKPPLARLAELAIEPIAKLSTAAESVETLAKEYAKLGERLNDLVEVRTAADVDAGKAPNIRSTLERLDAALSSAQSWLGDDGFKRQAHDLLERAGKAVDEAGALTRAWTSTAQNVDQKVNEASTRVLDLGEKAAQTLANADKAARELAGIMERVNKGEGTAGQLVTNPDLYRSLQDAATRADRALEELERLLEKLRNEGIRLGL